MYNKYTFRLILNNILIDEALLVNMYMKIAPITRTAQIT